MNRASTLLIALILAGCLDAASGTDPAMRQEEDGQLACGAICAVAVSEGPEQDWEPAVAVDPRDPAHVVAAVTEFTRDDRGIARGWIATYASFDGGTTWTKGTFGRGPASGTTDKQWRLIDAQVGFAADGTVIFLALSRMGVAYAPPEPAAQLTPFAYAADEYAIVAAISKDRGLTSPEVVTLATSSGVETPTGLGPGEIVDYEMFARTPGGTLIVTWLRKQIPATEPTPAVVSNQLEFSTSIDHGRTWSPPSVVAEGINGDHMLVALDEMRWRMVSTLCRDRGLSCVENAVDLVVYASDDAGRTWTIRKIGEGTYPGSPTIRHVAGRLHVVYSALGPDGRAFAAYVSSDDGGETWTDPLPIDPPPGEGAFYTVPTLAVDGVGRAYVSYYWTDGSRVERRALAIAPSGAASEPLTLDPDIRGSTTLLGDYMGMDATPDGAFAVWIGGRGAPRVTMGASDLRAAHVHLVGAPE